MPALSKIIFSLQTNNLLKTSIKLVAKYKNISNKNITGITYDPKKVRPGFAYLCMENEEFPANFNGKTSFDFIDQAKQNGAVLFVSEKNIPQIAQDPTVCLLLTDNLNRLAGFLACEVYQNPFQDIKIIGITGTKGKTTTSKIIHSLLVEAGLKVGVIGTIGIFYPAEFEDSEFLSNPHASEIFRIGAKMRQAAVNTLIMEVTSHGAKFERNSALNFDFLIMTNMASDHLDFHKTFEEYKNAKKLYFTRASELEKPAISVFNADDHFCNEFIEACHNANFKKNPIQTLTYGIENYKANIRAEIIKNYAGGSVFKILKDNKKLGSIHLKMPGLFNVYNSLAAFSVVKMMGLPFSTIKKTLNKKISVPGRFEIINNPQKLFIVIDYAHTYEALKNVLTHLKKIVTGKIVVVFGCGGNRDKTKRPLMGNIASKLADISIITSDNPRYEKPADIISDILAGIKKEKFKNVIVEEDRKLAIIKALKIIKKNDALLIAGKGHEMYQIVLSEYRHFSDFEVVKNFFKNSAKDPLSG